MFMVPLPLSITNLLSISSIVQLLTVNDVVALLSLIRLPLYEALKSGAEQFVMVTFSNTRLPLVILASLP